MRWLVAIAITSCLVFGESLEVNLHTGIGGEVYLPPKRGKAFSMTNHLIEDWEVKLLEKAYLDLREGGVDPCGGLIRSPFEGMSGKVLLTFDDGPDRLRTPQVLSILAKHKIKAIFFINGQKVNAQTLPVLETVLREGHTLGNHTQTHCRGRHNTSGCLGLSRNRFFREVSGTHRILKALLAPTARDQPTFAFLMERPTARRLVW